MRPSLSSLVRTVLLAESDDPANRPSDPAEGEVEEVKGHTDSFHDADENSKKYLERNFSDVLRIVKGGERDLIERDRQEVGPGWIDRYMARLSSRPITGSELETAFDESCAWSSVPAVLKSIYNRSVSWCLLTEEFVGLVDDTLKKIGARRVVEVGAGRGILAGMMRKRGYEWQAYDATSVQSSGVKKASAARVLAALGPGSCDVIAVSWAHHADDWDVALLDAAERLQVPILSIAVPPDVPGAYFSVNGVEGSPSMTHSGNFWSRVNSECSVSYADSSESRRDGVFVITPRSIKHPLPETKYHVSDSEDVIYTMISYIFHSSYGHKEGGEDAIASLPYIVRWKLGVDEQGTDYTDDEIFLAENVLKQAESFMMLQKREEIREKSSVRMPSVKEWLPSLVQEVCSFVKRRKIKPDVMILDKPVGGSWFSVKEPTYM